MHIVHALVRKRLVHCGCSVHAAPRAVDSFSFSLPHFRFLHRAFFTYTHAFTFSFASFVCVHSSLRSLSVYVCLAFYAISRAHVVRSPLTHGSLYITHSCLPGSLSPLVAASFASRILLHGAHVCLTFRWFRVHFLVRYAVCSLSVALVNVCRLRARFAFATARSRTILRPRFHAVA